MKKYFCTPLPYQQKKKLIFINTRNGGGSKTIYYNIYIFFILRPYKMKKIFLYFFAPSKEKKKLTFINTRNGGGLHSGGPGGGRGGHPRGLHATVAATREATLGLAGTRRVSVAL